MGVMSEIDSILRYGSETELLLFLKSNNMTWYDAVMAANKVWKDGELKRHNVHSKVQEGGDGLAPCFPEVRQ
tara:strand:- start:142 stop:357 length:216 start_codon:yes stop_codon:yes gene_type:complete